MQSKHVSSRQTASRLFTSSKASLKLSSALKRRRWIMLGVLFCTTNMLAFEIKIHRQITMDSLKALTALVGGSERHFSDTAIMQINDANERTDNVGYPFSAALFHSERHFTDENFAGGSQRVLDMSADIISKLTATVPDGPGARNSLGTALHTIQDFYSHTNWEELGNLNINGFLGEGSVPFAPSASPVCEDDHNTLTAKGGGALTSGYYNGALGCGAISAGKCYHGDYHLIGVPFIADCVGINKDLDASLATLHSVPLSPFHVAAADLARQATDKFVQSVLDKLAGNDKALSALLDVHGDIAFVIDTTGSMSDEISLVKGAVQRIATTNAADPSKKPDNWVLEPFNDPGYGPIFSTPDVDKLLSQLGTLTASGGGDCPELAWHGILQAVQKSGPNAKLFFFSDADAKDQDLADEAIALAENKNIQLNYFNTGSCSPPDPTFINGANLTGGKFLFLQRSEDGIVDQFINPLLTGNLTRVLSRNGAVSAASPVSTAIPIDSTVTSLVVSVTIDAPGSIQLVRPSGVPVSAGDGGVQVSSLSTGKLFVISGPEAGSWLLKVTGSGSYCLAVDAQSSLSFLNFAFVQQNQDMHGGYFPIPGRPIAGNKAIGKAVVVGTYSNALFSIEDTTGAKIADLTLAQNYPDAAPSDFIGAINLPGGAFRVTVRGLDTAGNPFERQFAALYQASSVEIVNSITPGPSGDTIGIGAATSVPFTITNYGADGTFAVNIIDSAGYVSSVMPATVVLKAGSSQIVSAILKVPSGAIVGSVDTLTGTVKSITDVSVMNSTSIDLNVGVGAASSGQLIVAADQNRVQVFSVDGSVLRQFAINKNGQFLFGPSGIASDVAGNVFLGDTLNKNVLEFDNTGAVVRTIGSFGGGDGQFRELGGMASDANGDLLVVDRGNSRVERFSNTGEYKSQFGSMGTDQGKFFTPVALAVDNAGTIYVADATRVQKFTSDGLFVSQFFIQGSNRFLFGPSGITIDTAGDVFLSDLAAKAISKFDSSGNYVQSYGSYGSGIGMFANGIGSLAILGNGDVVAADSGNEKIQQLDPTSGMFHQQIGLAGNIVGQFQGNIVLTAGYQ